MNKKGKGLGTTALSYIKKAASAVPLGRIINKAIDALPVELHLPGGYK